MTCGPYDRAKALIEKRVTPEGIDLDIFVNAKDPGRRLKGPKGPFDVAEYYTGQYMADLAHKQLGYTAIPIFVKRMFRHSYNYINTRCGIRKPSDLNGRRIGIQNWFTSAALWSRGILEDEWGLDISSVTWVARWRQGHDGWTPPPWLKLETIPDDVTIFDLLAAADIQGAFDTGVWAPDVHPDIGFLFPNYGELERDYFRRTGIFPIMHTLLVRTAVLDEHPWVAMSLFNAWMDSKKALYKELEWQRVHMTSLWYRALREEEIAVAGEDFYRWGFSGGQAELGKMLEYAFRYGLTPRRFVPEEMFHPSTLGT
jgi:4,5-dihydroxyphthalate decarboxylase